MLNHFRATQHSQFHVRAKADPFYSLRYSEKIRIEGVWQLELSLSFMRAFFIIYLIFFWGGRESYTLSYSCTHEGKTILLLKELQMSLASSSKKSPF